MPSQKGSDIKRICILDDNPLILMSLKRALNAPGYEIFSVSGREEFAELLENYSFDLVITDYYLKDSTAEDIMDMLVKKSPGALLMIMSGRPLPDNLNRPYIKKPFSINEIRKKVAELLSEKKDES
ncbi:MAG: response regulator [Thermodesulfovibrionales bacterium]